MPAGLAIALLGTALSLVNFGIDEFINPRLRSRPHQDQEGVAPQVRMRVGFTPAAGDRSP